MKGIPFEIGMVHFVGIGGIGMSGIAEVMHNLGYSVQGSDISENANVQRLRKLGVDVKIGQNASTLFVQIDMLQQIGSDSQGSFQRLPLAPVPRSSSPKLPTSGFNACVRAMCSPTW